MDELIRVHYDKCDSPTVSGRELHDALGIKTAYKDWFPRMCEYGFVEGTDFNPLNFEQVRLEGNREVSRQVTDHQITVAMAKELCMIQRSEAGRLFRQYFIRVEEAWNSPDAVMMRALQFAKQRLAQLEQKNALLADAVAVQKQQIMEMQPKAGYYDIVLNCKDLVAVSLIAKDYGWSAKKLNNYLSEKGVQYRQGKVWLLYQKYAEKGYTNTKTFNAPGSDGELHNHVHTYWTQSGRLFIYDLMKQDGIVPLIEREK